MSRLPHRQGRRHASSWPVIEKVDMLSLELLTIDVQTPEVYTSKGVPVKVDGVAQIKVKGDDISIATAVGTISEQGRGRNQKHRHADARRPFARDSRHDDGRGNLPEPRRLRPEGPGSGRRRHGATWASASSASPSATSATRRATSTRSANRASPRSNATPSSPRPRPTAIPSIRSAQANQAGQEAKFLADTKVAEAQRDYQSNVAQYQATVNRAKGAGRPRV